MNSLGLCFSAVSSKQGAKNVSYSKRKNEVEALDFFFFVREEE
jgi:hypothetical protein